MNRAPSAVLAAVLALTSAGRAQINLPHGLGLVNQIYLGNLGVVPSPSAIEFSADGTTLYVSGAGNTEGALIYTLPVLRHPGTNRILGFGFATPYSPAPFIDAGLQLGPNGVLFFSEFPHNKLGEIVNGTVYEFPLPPETHSPGGLVFIPPGMPGAGTMLISNWNAGDIWSVALTPNANGSFTPTTATLYAAAPGIRCEGLRFVPAGPYAGDLLLADFASPDGHIRRFDIDPVTGMPVGGAATPSISDVVTNFGSLDGLAFDPVTHDLFVTDWDLNSLHQITGFTTLQPLVSSRPTLPVGGGTVYFDLRAGTANTYRAHFLAVSASGTSPGFPLGPVTLPLNVDPLTMAAVDLVNSPLFPGFFWNLNTTGQSTAALQVPAGLLPPAAAGITLHFAYLLLYPADYVSNAVSLTIVP